MASTQVTSPRSPKVPVAPPLVGAHMSIAGGVWRAFARGAAVGANCIQVFVKGNVQWRLPRLTPADVLSFNRARAATGINVVIAHCSYLVNLATTRRAIFRKSLESFKRELELTRAYGIPWLVFHPGNHMGAGTKRGIAGVSSAVAEALGKVAGPGVLVETTAGAGTAVGSSFEEVAEIIRLAGGGPRIGVCLDTAHIFAAGYDISSEEAFLTTKARLARAGLWAIVKAIHVNDSKGALGSRVDRHAHIGKGRIGRKAFEMLMRDADLLGVPKILETPKGGCGKRNCDRTYIALLRRMAGRPDALEV